MTSFSYILNMYKLQNIQFRLYLNEQQEVVFATYWRCAVDYYLFD